MQKTMVSIKTGYSIYLGICISLFLLFLFPQKTFATTVSDNFNRADGGLGSNWTTMTGTNAPQIVTNVAEPGTSNTANVAYWSANSFGSNQFVQATLPSITGTDDGPAIGVRFANSRGYFLFFNHASGTVSLYRMDTASSWTVLATSATLTIAGTDVWKIETIGSTIVGFQNGNQVVEASDSTYTSGSPGIWLYYASNQIDNWSGGDLPTEYSLGGTVSGISGTAVLQNSDGTTLNVSNNGTFAFNIPYPAGSSYSVSVTTNPTGQTCNVVNGSGTVNANVTTISLNCSGNPLSTSAQDNFNRADGSLGANWTDANFGGLQITSQTVVGTNAGGVSGDMRTAETYASNQYSQIEVGAMSSNQWIGPTVRMQNNGQNYYLGLYDFNNGSPFLQIFKSVNGSFTGLTGQLSISQLSTGSTLKLIVVGDTIAFLVNGVEKQATFDTTLTGGSPGIAAFGTPAADNWAGGNAGFTVDYISTDANGVESYDVISQNDGNGPQVIRVLRPTSPAAGMAHNFIYTLPVQPGVDNTTFGDGLDYLRSLDAQNQYNLTIIEPSFYYDPWYADNPNDSTQQYETFIASELQPWVTANLATSGTEQHWLIGFSKSGLGAQDLVLKHPDLFTLAASWDTPFSTFSYSRFGTDSQSQYGTEANFINNYELSIAFLQAHGVQFTAKNRIWVGGYNLYQQDDTDYDIFLTSMGVEHTTETPTNMTHSWTSGWVPLALAALSQDSINFSITPTPTPTTSTPTPTSSSSQSSSGTSTSSSSSPPSCSSQSPGNKAPQLYGALSQSASSILLYFTPADTPVSRYVLEYGTKSGEYPYGIQDMGINTREQMTYLVQSLAPGTTYYFRIRGANGCADGPWSNEFSTTTQRATNTSVSTSSSCQQYTVKLGDSLWSIAAAFLNDGSKYHALINANILAHPLLAASTILIPGWKLAINCNSSQLPQPQQKNNQPSQTKTYMLKVKIVDTHQKPLSGVQVGLTPQSQQIVTNNQGIATFSNISIKEETIIATYKNIHNEQKISLSDTLNTTTIIMREAATISPLPPKQTSGIPNIFSAIMHLFKK